MYHINSLSYDGPNPDVRNRYSDYNRCIPKLLQHASTTKVYQLRLSQLFLTLHKIAVSSQDDPDWFNQLNVLISLRDQLLALRITKGGIPRHCYFPVDEDVKTSPTELLESFYEKSGEVLVLIKERIRTLQNQPLLPVAPVTPEQPAELPILQQERKWWEYCCPIL